MKTVLILALIVAVCMCSLTSPRARSEEGGCSPMVLQKSSDNQGNVNGGIHQNREKEDQDFLDSVEILNFIERFEENKEAELREMVKRAKEERKTPEVKLLCLQMEQQKPLRERARTFLESVLCRILGLNNSNFLRLVKIINTKVICSVRCSPLSPVTQNPEVQDMIDFMDKIRCKLAEQ
jgi:hypothetical protein